MQDGYDQVTEKSPHVIARDYIADKGRTCRLKEKVRNILTKPRPARENLLGDKWMALFDAIEPAETKKT